ncbi:MAG: VUT family protein, partial [Spirochaetota bacterium]
MSSEVLWLILLAANFAAVMLAFRFFGRTGLVAWMVVSVIAANIQVTKTIELFGITATLGNIVYATSFLITDIFSE